MKKFITLALALVMVLAIAAPSLAMIDGQAPLEVNVSDVFSVKASLYNSDLLYALPSNGVTMGSVGTPAANTGWISGYTIYWGVSYTALKNATRANVNNMSFGLSLSGIRSVNQVSVAGAPSSSINAYYRAANGVWSVASAASVTQLGSLNLTADFNNPGLYKASGSALRNWMYDIPKDAGLLLYGSAVMEGSGELKATIGLSSLTADDVATMTWYQTTDSKINLRKANANTYIASYTGSNGAMAVVFDISDSGIVDHVYIASGANVDAPLDATKRGTWVQISQIYSGQEWTWVLVNAGTALDGVALDAVKAVFKLFGFNYQLIDKNAIYESNFVAKVKATNISSIYPWTLYSTGIIVPDDPVLPPKTGDAASIMGFVMIAMAIVAAAAVAYRKVRA